MSYWSMTGGQFQSAVDITRPPLSGTRLQAIGDINDDGTDDLVWQTANGQVFYWPMSNGIRQPCIDIHTPMAGSYLRGVGDIDGDGSDDIVWQSYAGKPVYWKISGGKYQSGIDIGTSVDAKYHLKGVGNINGEGADISSGNLPTQEVYMTKKENRSCSTHTYTTT